MNINFKIDGKVNPADAMQMLAKSSGRIVAGLRQVAVHLAEGNVRDAFAMEAGPARDSAIQSALTFRRRVREVQLDQLARAAEENVRLAIRMGAGRHRAVKHARDARRHFRAMEIKRRGWK